MWVGMEVRHTDVGRFGGHLVRLLLEATSIELSSAGDRHAIVRVTNSVVRSNVAAQIGLKCNRRRALSKTESGELLAPR